MKNEKRRFVAALKIVALTSATLKSATLGGATLRTATAKIAVLTIVALGIALLGSPLFADQATLDFRTSDGKIETRTAELVERDGVQYLTIPATDVPEGTKSLDVHHPSSDATAGEDGFFVFCNGMFGRFPERPDQKKKLEYVNGHSTAPVFGVKTPRGAFLAILTGLRYEAEYRVEYENGRYRVFPRYQLDGMRPYADVALEFHPLPPEATYADMAKVYRKYQLDQGVVRPLTERAQERPSLDYAARSPEIRVRLAWKPVPSPVPEQTAENEPDVHVAVTFDRFMQIVDEFQKQGISKAEFCLVGWNVGGHDGRYPQIFPVEEKLGGETKLREAIQKTQDAGYQIVCHTNNSDAYGASRIGGLWDESYLLINKDGKPNTYTTWGGGNMYETCPKRMFELFVPNDLAKLRELGFYGLHYIDVFSTVNPRTCRSDEHPLTKEDYAQWTNKIFAEAQKTLGGLGSEGGFDYCVSYLDYALYVSFYNPGTPTNPLVERHVPFWQLVYNGIVLNNPFTATTNFTIKDPRVALKLVEYGGRPTFYIYSRFRSTGDNWMGDADLNCATDEELTAATAKIKEGCDLFAQLADLQFCFMENHERLDDDVFATDFSDGSRVVTNYRDSEYIYRGETIAPIGWKRFKNE